MPYISLYLLFSMLAVIWFDMTRYRIPNWLVFGVLLAYPIGILGFNMQVDWLNGLYGLGVMFAIGYVIFALNAMGGGDIKLLIACALWVGLKNLAEFGFLVAIFGGVFALLIWISRRVLALTPQNPDKLPRILKKGEPMPYGVAIAVAFAWLMYTGKLPVTL